MSTDMSKVPGWEGSVGPFPAQYGQPHVYARSVHSWRRQLRVRSRASVPPSRAGLVGAARWLVSCSPVRGYGMSAPSIKARLLRAAGPVERHGLHKGDFWPGAEDDGGRGAYLLGDPISMAGALHLLYGNSEALGATVWLGRQIGEPNIQRWTDRPTVTAAEVVATVRRAAS